MYFLGAMHTFGSLVVAAGVATTSFLFLEGCGGGDDGGSGNGTDPSEGGSSTTSGPAPPEPGGPNCWRAEGDDCVTCMDGHQLFNDSGRCFYKCNTDLNFGRITTPMSKGLALDDTTLRWCSDKMPFHWPNTDEPVGSIRMFKAWQEGWTEMDKRDAWTNIVSYAHTTGAKVLVGSQVSCNETEDDEDWENVKELLTLLGSEHVMGVAIGNEMELLWQKHLVDRNGTDIWVDCMQRMWSGRYFIDKFYDRIRQLDELDDGAFLDTRITSVFGGFALGYGWTPFIDNVDGQSGSPAMINTFLEEITGGFGTRWAWVLNIYPYFDPNMGMDAGSNSTCQDAIDRATCLEPAENPYECLFTGLVKNMRDKMGQLNKAGGVDGTLWIGETGWSYPVADTLDSAVRGCEAFSSQETFQTYYERFLKWDLKMPAGIKGPDHVFWFTMRDSVNFDQAEGFGLVGNSEDDTFTCRNTTCKLQLPPAPEPPATALPVETTALPAEPTTPPAEEQTTAPPLETTTIPAEERTTATPEEQQTTVANVLTV